MTSGVKYVEVSGSSATTRSTHPVPARDDLVPAQVRVGHGLLLEGAQQVVDVRAPGDDAAVDEELRAHRRALLGLPGAGRRRPGTGRMVPDGPTRAPGVRARPAPAGLRRSAGIPCAHAPARGHRQHEHHDRDRARPRAARHPPRGHPPGTDAPTSSSCCSPASLASTASRSTTSRPSSSCRSCPPSPPPSRPSPDRRDVGLLEATAGTLPIAVRVDRPAEVGPDRLVNALAAARLHGAPAIVVDFGTATTFDVVAPDGAYVGGAIAPGLELGLEVLAARTARLPRVELRAPDRAIGRDTASAIQSGAIFGYQALAAGLLATAARGAGRRERRRVTDRAHDPDGRALCRAVGDGHRRRGRDRPGPHARAASCSSMPPRPAARRDDGTAPR